jgi:two-component system, sensor histidine kinase PdtaS
VALPFVQLARSCTGLSDDSLRHLQRLVASWQLLADLCFSDLLLLGANDGADGQEFTVLAHVRPTTGQTLYLSELIGSVVPEAERPVVARAWRQGDMVGGDTTIVGGNDRVRVQCIPVRHSGPVIAVVTRDSAMTSGRRPGELERQYLEVFDRLARMVAEGSYPFPHDEVELEEAPRVADGLIVLDERGQIGFASPNAISTLHRMGVPAFSAGTSSEAGFEQVAAQEAMRLRVPVTDEIEHGDSALLLKAIPLLGGDRVAGAFVLVRDVTDLRRRDRMLMSKDATIREIHHRVKNNLQTIAALLRLQRRRLKSREARDAIAESERRIRSIAIVHETLSRATGDVVGFSDIVLPLVRIVEETVSTDDLRLHFAVEGDAGELPGELATPLAVVLNELMQNAVDHAFPFDGDVRQEGHVQVRIHRQGESLLVEVIDDGVGLDPGFSLEASRGLGLSIVQTLVTTELGGSLEMCNDEGTRVSLRIPLNRGAPRPL